MRHAGFALGLVAAMFVTLSRGAVLLSDTFNLTTTNPNGLDVNFQLAERQSGILAPLTYTKGLEPTFSQVGNEFYPTELLLAGRTLGMGVPFR